MYAILAALVLSATPVQSFYVAPRGSDSSPCTEKKPCKTVASVVQRQPIKTPIVVYIRGHKWLACDSARKCVHAK